MPIAKRCEQSYYLTVSYRSLECQDQQVVIEELLEEELF